MQIQPSTLIVASILAAITIGPESVPAAAERPAEAIQDNSFLVEEAYNQEAGVVQHILNVSWGLDKFRGSDEHEWSFVFTQEWPVFTQAHQFSYTVPYSFVQSSGRWSNGIGDVLLNYRFQASMETERIPAFAPRISLILPTGDSEEGFGNDTLGYQLNLPVSKIVSDRWTVHGNAGATWLPDVNGHDLTGYHLGASAIYAVNRNFNLMIEAIASWDEETEEDRSKNQSFSAIISPGFRYAINHANDAQTVIGIAAPIGLTSAAPDYGVFLYCSFEHFFIRPTREGREK